MDRTCKSALAIALVFGLGFGASASAQSSGGAYDIRTVAIAGGGGSIVGGAYQITSTLGQPATSMLSGAGFVIFDGFWAPVGGTPGDIIFANGFDGL